MNKFAIYHRPKSNYAYPVSKNKLQIRLRTAVEDFDEVSIVYGDKYAWHKKKEKKMEIFLEDHDFSYYQTEVELTSNRYTYYFKLINKKGTFYFTDCGLLKSSEHDKNYFNAYLFHFPYINLNDLHKTPAWISGSAWYQIFPERFENGNPAITPKNVQPWGSKPAADSFMGGNLEGIEKRLEYLKELGINAIYMTPIFYSHSNHKYNIIDYFKIDPNFGKDEDFKRLVDKAHSMGMKVILDAVFNHCDPDFFAFKDVVKNKEKSKYRDWFFINSFPIDPKHILNIHNENQKDPNSYNHDWHIVKGKSVLPFECFGFCPTMPKLNTGNPEVRKYLIDAGKYWIEKFDIDGWRLDVSNEIDHFFWREFRKEVKEVKEDTLIIGEIWEDGEPWLRGDQFDGIMNYGLTQVIKDYIAHGSINIQEFKKRINLVLMRNTSIANNAMLNLLDSHDTERLFTTFNENEDKLIMALGMIYTFPGIPMIYYGTEVGMTGKGEPDCRKCMVWNKSEWNNFILSSVKKIIKIHKSEKALHHG